MSFSNLFIEANMFTYFADSNLAGKVIVLLLAFFSMLAWSVMLGKYADLGSLQRANLKTEKALANSRNVVEAAVNNAKKLRGPYAILLREAVVAWSRYENSAGETSSLSLRMGLVENALQRAISRQIMKYESKMILLGSIISGAPFLGLLGTTWGVMDSFGSMSSQSTATLQMLAPGVSGALLTTIAGLVVAIPSVFGYNFLLARVKSLVTELENFASSLADRIELESKIAMANKNTKRSNTQDYDEAEDDDEPEDDDVDFKLKPISEGDDDLIDFEEEK